MRNVYLFRPDYSTNSGDHSEEWLPYSLGLLWVNALRFPNVSQHFELAGVFYRRLPLAAAVDALDSPSIAAFSCYVWNLEYCLALGRAIKDRFPDCHTIYGGPGIPHEGSAFKEKFPWVNFCIPHEADSSFGRLMSTLAADSEHAGKTEIGELACVPLTDLSSPFLEGFFDGIMGRSPNVHWSTAVETTRGCPYSCTFCVAGSSKSKEIRPFPISRVTAELDWLAEHGVSFLYFTDNNFGILGERDEAIVEHLVALRARTGFPRSVCFQWSKNSSRRIVNLASKLGKTFVRGFTLSLQSLHKDALSAIERRNVSTGSLQELLSLCEEAKVESYTELILGLPEETYDSWCSGLTNLLELGQHSFVEVSPLVILQNSALAERSEQERYGILSRKVANLSLCSSIRDDSGIDEYLNLVYETASMPHADLMKSYMFSWTIFNFHYFGWLQVVARILNRFMSVGYRSFYDAMYQFAQSSSGVVNLEYRRTVSLLEELYSGTLSTKAQDEALTFTRWQLLMWSQEAFHLQAERTWDNLMEFLQHFTKNLREPEDGFLSELFRFQKEAVSAPDLRYPRIATFQFDFPELLKKGSTLQNNACAITFDLPIPFSGKEDYRRRLAVQRRQGFGRTAWDVQRMAATPSYA